MKTRPSTRCRKLSIATMSRSRVSTMRRISLTYVPYHPATTFLLPPRRSPFFLTECSPDSQSTSKNYSKIQRDVQQKKATVDSAMKVHEQNTVRPLSFITFLRFSAADRMPISICLLTNAFCFLKLSMYSKIAMRNCQHSAAQRVPNWPLALSPRVMERRITRGYIGRHGVIEAVFSFHG